MKEDGNTEALDQEVRTSKMLSEFEDFKICRDECDRAFVWTNGEQECFYDTGLNIRQCDAAAVSLRKHSGATIITAGEHRG